MVQITANVPALWATSHLQKVLSVGYEMMKFKKMKRG